MRAYGDFELVIAALGLGSSLVLPHLGPLSAMVSAYFREGTGWYVLSPASYLARAVFAVLLLTPITVLMGGTLTLLIRHLVRRDPEASGWRIAALYGINTAGAALGAFVTDFALVPTFGLQVTQLGAVGLNVVAGVGARVLSTRAPEPQSSTALLRRGGRDLPDGRDDGQAQRAPSLALAMTGLSLAMAGFAAMGMEILWFRHLTILLGGFRAVFSLLLTFILIGLGTGSLLSGVLERRSQRPVPWLIAVQGLFVAATLAGLAGADARQIETIVRTAPAYRSMIGQSIQSAGGTGSEFARTLTELWFNARPMLLEIGLPVLLMGFTFPLANAVIQRAERSVGTRAGALYLCNTAGAVCGSLAAGFLLLPTVGLQASATILMMVALLAVIPLGLAGPALRRNAGRVLLDPPGKPSPQDPAYTRESGAAQTFRSARWAGVPLMAGSVLAGGLALALWLRLPSDYVIARAVATSTNTSRLIMRREGLNEVIAVTELPDKSRRLLTNGHPMSATTWLSQRYMRALAHIPLLAIDNPQNVLVIGFGVGNTAQAAALHPSIRRIEIADLSRDILSSASFFDAANGDVLHDPRVAVYVNDGRQHLQMQPPRRYDLITLEPPPIGYAGVAALYSTEFYALARSRLAPRGFISQWLPAYQVPGATTLSMIRAFIDVFPEAVLVSGSEADLLLIGANESSIQIDPVRLAAALSRAPRAQADLQRLDLGTVREIVGTFVGSSRRLAEATRDRSPVTDDRPIQEYGVKSLLNFGEAVPASIVGLGEVAAWCPTCFADGRTISRIEGLETYLALLGRAYMATPAEIARARALSDSRRRLVAGSAYLGAIVPETADVHNLLGITYAEKGQLDEAIAQFREALNLEPEAAVTHWHLGAALAERGARRDAIEHLRRSVQLDPTNPQARQDLEAVLALDRVAERP